MLGVIAAIVGGTAAAAGGVTCWKGLPVEKGQIGGPMAPLVEWRIRWACTRHLVQLRHMAARSTEWTPWETVAELASKASAKAAAITMSGSKLAGLRAVMTGVAVPVVQTARFVPK